jgi:DNA-binding IclR family transcriptional regulator
MPKKRREARTGISVPMPVDRMPPPLSEEMIDKLRAAVDAAHRRRMPDRCGIKKP